MRRNKGRPTGRLVGFTLLELSIVIAIIATIAVAGMSMGNSMIESAKRAATNNKLDAIETALLAFRVSNNRLPCPADPALAFTNPSYDIESGTAGTCGGGSTTSYTVPAPNTGTVVEGAVPVKSLGLPDAFQLDSWGRKFTYAVWTPLTAKATSTSSPAAFLNYGISPSCGAITVQDAGHGNRTTAAAYALLSYGPDGHGGYLPSGSRYNAHVANTDEDANAHYNSSGVDTGLYAATYVQKDTMLDPSDASNSFQHIVRFKARWQMADAYDDFSPQGEPCTPGFRIDGPTANGLAGNAVAVGDVNGDGIPDLVIAANGSGYVYIVFGTKAGFPDPLPLSSLNGTNGFSLFRATAGDGTGASVAIGDTNNDGFADIIIGAYNTAPGGRAAAGSAFVVFGKANWSASATYTLNNVTATHGVIDGAQGVRFDGATAGDTVGRYINSVAAGDVNGDGKADVILGAIGANSGAGYTYVVFGNSPLLPQTTINVANGTTSVTVNSAAGLIAGETIAGPNITAGTTISSCGGTPCTTSLVLSNNVSAAAIGTALNAATVTLGPTFINGTNGVRFDGVTANDRAGEAVATGDINGDGQADLIIGAPTFGGLGGYVYTIFGKSLLLPQTTITAANGTTSVTVNSATGLIAGETVAGPNITAGTTISSCGGPPCTTSLTLSNTVSAAAIGTALNVSSVILNTSYLDGTHAFRLDGNAGNNDLVVGDTLATGDVNGDGYQDIIIGDTNAIGNKGYVYVVFGKAAGWSATQWLNWGAGNLIDGTQGVVFKGVTANDHIGTVATGDINGDGKADVIIGAYNANSNAGYTYVIFGKNTSWGASGTIILNTGAGNLIDGTQGFRLDGATANDDSGGFVTSGDVNGDGIADLITGANNASPNAVSRSGSTYVYFGKKGGWPNPNSSLGGL